VCRSSRLVKFEFKSKNLDRLFAKHSKKKVEVRLKVQVKIKVKVKGEGKVTVRVK